ncbi:MAG: RNA methyltransferase [Actinomycetota bacterium]|nr:RNA methyltransferase [Actinomycetota bacterium]
MLAARKLLRRSQRDAQETYLLEGPVPVLEALRNGAAVRTVFVSTEYRDDGALDEAVAEVDAAIVRATSAVLEALSDAVTPQGVVAVAEMEDVALPDLDEGVDLVLVLDQVRDPGNAGTLVRSATAAGAGAVVFTSGSVDPYAPKTVRSAAGMLGRVDLVRNVTLEKAAGHLGGRGFDVVGTDPSATSPYDALDYTSRTAFVVGNEAWGIPEAGRAFLTHTVRIPMPGDAESLNAGIAGSLLLFEAVRQRRGRLGGTAD